MRGDEPLSAAEAESLLQWWTEAGVDCLVDERPRDWLRPQPAPPAAASVVRENVPAPAPAPRQLPDQLGLFRVWLASEETLPFAVPSAPRICSSGDPASGLMMLSDMPTAADCSAGILLSGQAGALFDRMLAAIGRDRASIYLASLSCLRSPGGSFTSETAAQCAELARHHIGLAAPRAVLLLGDACAKALLGVSVIQARGRWHQISTTAGDSPALVSFHPSYLLEQPAAKQHAWADLQML